MSAILPIPTNRISDLLASQRITRQLQSDQIELFRAQTQISTGRRIISPSDDAPASLRAMNLQRILERKSQAQVSLQDSVLFLGNAEIAINSVSDILNNVKSEALGVDSTLSTENERQSVVDQINRALEQLVTIGNSQFRERYLFAGSRSQQQPYDYVGDFVAFNGNEDHLRSFVDVGFLYETNIPGGEVFGGISQQVLGTVDLNPHLTTDTQVQHLNGGAGLSGGAVEIVYVDAGNNATSSVVDLSGAATIGDVARYLQDGVPASSGITVEVTGAGLTLSTASGTDGVLVQEVGEGRTARDLGIFGDTPQATLVGDDIRPVLLKTTRLADLLGTKSQATVVSGGANNDFIVRATQNGADAGAATPLNGVTIQIVDGESAGREFATYDGNAGTLTVTIESGVSTASQVVDAINAEASGLFSAEIDYRDAASTALAGGGIVALSATAVTAGGSGEVLDQSHGLRVTNGGQTVDVDVSSAETVEDLLNILNQAQLGLQVEINAAGNGINARSRWSGADLTIGENGGQLATQLGIRTYNGDTRLEGFNRGVGVATPDDYRLQLALDGGLGGVTNYHVNLSDDAVADFSSLSEPVGGLLDLKGTYSGLGGNNLSIVFAEDALSTTHSASLAGDVLTVTVGVGDGVGGTLANGATISLDQIFSSIDDVDFTGAIDYHAEDVVGSYTVGTDAGQSITFSGAGSVTVDDVIERISLATSGNVAAAISTVGNGLELSFDNSAGQTLTATGGVAERLGFFDQSKTAATSTTGTLTVEDRHTLESDSVFNTLMRLREAIITEDYPAVGREIDRIDTDLDRVNFARSELGARLQSLETLQFRHEDEEVALRSALSEEIDVDLTEAISEFTARQYALQASLQVAGNILQLTLLDFL